MQLEIRKITVTDTPTQSEASADYVSAEHEFTITMSAPLGTSFEKFIAMMELQAIETAKRMASAPKPLPQVP